MRLVDVSELSPEGQCFQIHTRVELGIDGLDEPLLGSLPVRVLLDLKDNDTSDKLGSQSRPPAHRDLVWRQLSRLMHEWHCLRLTVLQLFQMFKISKGMAG